MVQVVRGSPSFDWQDMQTLIRGMLESAEDRFRLATAYFSPTPTSSSRSAPPHDAA